MMRQTVRDNEEGSLLLSTFHLLFFISFLIVSLTGIVYNQMMQLQQISQAYEAKALIEVSKSMLREKAKWEDVETATLYFSQGEVVIRKASDTEFILAAKLNNSYTSSQTIAIAFPVEPADRQADPESLGSDDIPLIEQPIEADLELERIEIIDDINLSE